MTLTFAANLDALAGWRRALAQCLDEVSGFLFERDLIDALAHTQLCVLRDQVGAEKLIVAFVADFSRGKSELINAIFFADAGRRVLPASPGRTTMCPVEIGWDAHLPATLQLLPIETRSDAVTLSELRAPAHAAAWTTLALQVDASEQLAHALAAVTRTQWVTRQTAQELGFWNDAHPEANPLTDARGHVEVPVWRHALINYPHPLLRQGLVVLDTPGLNAIGAEPELTLGLLPTAHATVFLLGADTGVTQTDLGVWRDHLGALGLSRFVVLNKIDALLDPLAAPGQVDAQIDTQCRDAANVLGIGVDRVFPLSAREALVARVTGDAAGLRRSRLPALEDALGAQLLPQRRQVLEGLVLDSARQLEHQVERRLGGQRRQLAEQLVELRGLRGKSGARVAGLLQRVELETVEFEQCGIRLAALRVVHARMLRDALAPLAPARLRDELDRMQAQMQASLFNLGARKAFGALCARLRAVLNGATRQSDEIGAMLGASFTRLNDDFGFTLALNPAVQGVRGLVELDLIERNYLKFLGLSHALRLAQPKVMAQFQRMLVTKLRVVFEGASGELEAWSRAHTAQLDTQLRERRSNFRHRRESIQRVQTATGDLDQRVREIEAHDASLEGFAGRTQELFAALREQASAALPMPPAPAVPARRATDDAAAAAAGAWLRTA